jgi:transcriptional regulator with XRE-family HTH domain
MRLRAVRAAMGLNGLEFAELVGLSNSQISAWERGSMPRQYGAIVAQIASATGVDRGWLAFGPNQGHPLVVIDGGAKVPTTRRPLPLFVDAA